MPESPELHEYSGAIHVHSTRSDGHRPLPDIMRTAGRAGLDFLALTDHDTLADRPHEGWWGSTLLVVGHEISPEKEHYLAFGLDETVPPALGESGRHVAEVAARGGLGFIAHPFDRGNPRVHVPGYEWRPAAAWAERPDSPPPDGPFTGIEVWNYYSEWLGSERTIPAAVRALAMPRVFSPGPSPRGLALWDAIGRRRRAVGIGGLDAHGLGAELPWRRIWVMTYEFAFRTLRTNVLLERPLSGAPSDLAAVLEALRQGRALLVDASQGPAKGTRFWAAPEAGGDARDEAPPGGRGDGEPRALPGDELTPASPLLRDGRQVELHLTVPVTARLTILRDGRPLAEGIGRSLTAIVHGPGVYRAEARRWRGLWRSWVYTNPIYIRGGEKE
ncbi:MAG: CehA/McbA family metallohydrolase [Bacillota bacterium]